MTTSYMPPHMPKLIIQKDETPKAPEPPPTDPKRFPQPYFATMAQGGNISTLFAGGLIDTLQQLIKAKFVWNWDMRAYDGDSPGVRNSVVANFMATNCTHLFFINPHIGFSANDVVRVLSSKQDVVCAAPPCTVMDWSLVKRTLEAERNPALATSTVDARVSTETIQGMGNDLVEVEWASADFMCIRRAVFDKLIQANPGWLYTDPGQRRTDNSLHTVPGYFEGGIWDETFQGKRLRVRLTEDQMFCRRWQQVGGKVFMHMGVQLAKIGPHAYRGSPHDSVERVGNITITEKAAE